MTTNSQPDALAREVLSRLARAVREARKPLAPPDRRRAVDNALDAADIFLVTPAPSSAQESEGVRKAAEMLLWFQDHEHAEVSDAKEAWEALREALATPPTDAAIVHPETRALVEAFTAALIAKLSAAEAKYGYTDNWRTDDWEAECQRQLQAHVRKGDPLDVAAYAGFCWARGWPASAPPRIEDRPGLRAGETNRRPRRV